MCAPLVAGPVPGPIELRWLWAELISGRVALAEVRHAGARCYARLRPGSGDCLEQDPALQLLERVFLGDTQKVLAYEHDVTGATIATRCANVLEAFAPGQEVSRAPMLLVMAVHAAHGVAIATARCDDSCAGEPGPWINCELPFAGLQQRLSPCEFDVARLLIEGKRHSEIATLRKTSVRTTANQLASIFSKLRVSGRAQLRCKAIFGSLTNTATPRNQEPTLPALDITA